jgi:hypothetical protein
MCNGTTNNTPHFTEEQESCFPMSEWPVCRALPSSSIAHWNKTCDQFEEQTVSDDDRSCTAKTLPQIPTKHTVATGDDPTVSMSISDPQSFRQKQLAALEMLSVQLMAVNSLEQVYMPQTLRRRRRCIYQGRSYKAANALERSFLQPRAPCIDSEFLRHNVRHFLFSQILRPLIVSLV